MWRCNGRLNGPLELITFYRWFHSNFNNALNGVSPFVFTMFSQHQKFLSRNFARLKIVSKVVFFPDWNDRCIKFLYSFLLFVSFVFKSKTKIICKMKDFKKKKRNNNNKIWFRFSISKEKRIQVCVCILLAGSNWIHICFLCVHLNAIYIIWKHFTIRKWNWVSTAI